MPIEILLNTPINILSITAFEKIWKFIGKSYKATKFGSTEPLKNKYSINEASTAFDLIEKRLIVRGGKQFTLLIEKRPIGLYDFIITIDQTQFTQNEYTILFQFIKIIHKNLGIVYGRGCTIKEFEEKHKVYVEVNGNLESNGYAGGSMWDFADYLPGIYWLNVFGEVLTSALNIEKIKSLENLNFDNSDGDLTIFHFCDNIFTDNKDKRIKEEEKIGQLLGRKHFFNIHDKKTNFAHPPVFIEYLNNLKKLL